MYLPKGKPPFPGVLVPCGHSANGKASEAYQRASILLAKNGLAALCYDPIGQGERYQILNDEGKRKHGSTTEHTLVGIGCILLGTNTARYRIYDGMRAIDYMLSRDDIDPKRIGCTGNSGGGTLTSYLMALDQRIVCAAPSCYLTNLHRLIDTRGPQDAEQNIHGQIAFGMDHGDYVMMRAPKPTLMCVATRDFFDIDGAWATFREAKRFYTRLGFAERVDLIETDAKHGFSTQLREGMVRWMRRWLLGIDDAITEPEFEVFTDEDLQCTPDGQVMLLEGARSVPDLSADIDKRLARERSKLWKNTPRADALQNVRDTAGVRRLADIPECKLEKLGEVEREAYRIEKVVLRPHDGIPLPALAFLPPRSNDDAYLYLHEGGKEADAGEGGAIEELVRQGHVVLAVDLPAIGETRSGKPGGLFGSEFKTYFLAYHLGKSFVGMRTEDILASARVLREYRKRANPYRIHLIAVGEPGPAALHAAALEPEMFASLTLRRSLVSWTNVVHTPETRNQLVNAVHGALRVYDLPDLLATLPEDSVTIEEPVDAAGEPLVQ
jgi:dienelactone hydrolase